MLFQIFESLLTIWPDRRQMDSCICFCTSSIVISNIMNWKIPPYTHEGMSETGKWHYQQNIPQKPDLEKNSNGNDRLGKS